MMRSIILVLFIALLVSCAQNDMTAEILVADAKELHAAIEKSKPGDEIIMADGIWNNVQIKFTGQGTEQLPITLRAETAGKVFLEGKSDLKFGGEYLIASGLFFRNGQTPSDVVVEFRTHKDTVANHCSLNNSVILDYNQLKRDRQDRWVEFHGRHNSMDQCYIAGKSNRGPTVRVNIEGNKSIRNYHQITNNHFGPRPAKGGPSGETIQLGNSFTSMSPSNTLVANNLFERCNGEVEVISSKTNFNEFRNNDEVQKKFFDDNGSVKQALIKALHDDVTVLLFPSRSRALNLNKGYKVMVEEQSYIYGRDANVKVMDNVYKEIKEGQLTGVIKPIVGP